MSKQLRFEWSRLTRAPRWAVIAGISVVLCAILGGRATTFDSQERVVAYRAWVQRRGLAQAEAKAAFQSAMRDEGRDCQAANTQAEQNFCYLEVVPAVRAAYDRYLAQLRVLLEPPPGERADRPSRQQLLAEGEEIWRRYSTAMIRSAGEEFNGGSIRPSAESAAEILLLRSRLRELEQVYHMTLHN